MPLNGPKCSRLPTLLSLLALLAAGALHARPGPRVIVLGFDGADHRLVERWMAEGKLPNLSKLAATGSFAPLLPTVPAQTPVSWSTFSTGISPGRTQIFDFLKRDPKSYRPAFAVAEEGTRPFLWGARNPLLGASVLGSLVFLLVVVPGALLARSDRLPRLRLKHALVAAALLAAPAAAYGARLGRLLPESVPTVTNNRRGTPFWEAAGAAGVRSVVLHVPVTFPAVDFAKGRLLSGLGVPDVRGRIGTPSFYTSDPFFAPRSRNEFSVELIRLPASTGSIETEVFGPYNKLFPSPEVLKVPMTLTVEGERLRIAPRGAAPVTLKEGEWSDWVRFTFAFNPLIKLHGIGRFHLAELTPEIKLYLSPIHFDPGRLPPSVKISAPASFAGDLADEYGPFKTMGWQIDTWSMSEGTIDERTFLDDAAETVRSSRRLMNDRLAGRDFDLFVQVFEFPDRVAHCFWRFLDPEHPAHEPEKARIWAPSVQRTYVQMDAIVGDAMKALRKDDLLLVLSDHGFASWRRSVNYNTWLVQNGYLALTGGNDRPADLEMLFGRGEFWPNVDWSRTKAYAMGLGEVYINVRGREGKGIVAPGAEYEAVRAEIRQRLLELADPKNGRRAVSRVFTREEAYGSFDADLVPDLFVTNTEGYRVGWQSTLGVVTPEVFEDNAQVWSGDHCSVDPALVPGVLFSSRRLDETKPRIADVPATILKVLNVPPPQELDGRPLL